MKKKMKKKNDNSLRSLYSKKVLNKIDEKINLLGVSSRVSTLTFLNIRLITMIVLGIVVFVSFELLVSSPSWLSDAVSKDFSSLA